MMPPKLHYMPFYTSEFLLDERVLTMSLAEIGMYVKLMCFAWREGSIPASVDAIAAIVGRPITEVTKLWTAVSKCWVENADGRLINLHMEKIRADVFVVHDRKAAAGKRGAQRRWSERSARSESGLETDGSAIALPLATPLAEPCDPNGIKTQTQIQTHKRPVVTPVTTAQEPKKLEPPTMPKWLPAAMPDEIGALSDVAVEFLAAFGNARSDEARKKHGPAYVEALAIFRSRGISVADTWRAFSDAWLAENGKPLFASKAKKAVAFIAPRPTNGRSHRADRPVDELVTVPREDEL